MPRVPTRLDGLEDAAVGVRRPSDLELPYSERSPLPADVAAGLTFGCGA